MQTLPNSPKAVNSLDTLAQLASSEKTPLVEEGFDLALNVSSESQKSLLKRARAKYLTNAIVFRLADVDSPLNKSYWNSYHCSSVLIRENGTVTGRYCKNRWCMVCNRIRTAQLIHQYQSTINSWSDKHFLTLTVPNVKGYELPLTIRIMNNALRRIIKSIAQRERRKSQLFPKIKGLRKLECTYNPVRDDYHPHFHLITDSEFAAVEIKEQWLKKFPSCSDLAQKVSRADDDTAIELFKYFTKILTKQKGEDNTPTYSIQPLVLDTIFRSIKNIRTFQSFGFVAPKVELDHNESVDQELSASNVAFLDRAVFGWFQEFSDWLDVTTGETLTGYEPAEKMRRLTDA